MVIKLVARKVGMRDYFPDLQSLLIQEWGAKLQGALFLRGIFPWMLFSRVFFLFGGGDIFSRTDYMMVLIR